jgi:peptidyl-prolyl cis-trans isomerase SurA
MQNSTDMNPVRKLFLIPVCFLLLASAVRAQSIFTINGTGTSKEDFLKAYNKNNNSGKATERSYRDYLELYIRYKLKVRAAYEQQLDTLPAQRTELLNFRNQVAENYLKDEASLDKMVNEAFTRGQRDLHLAHIFIGVPKNATPSDTLKAYEKAMDAYNALKKGKGFRATALVSSDDPAVRTNGGDIGYITVFTLPYELENLAYGLVAGQFSKPYRSKAGYHIFKDLGERKSLGRIRVAQILIAFPPTVTTGGQASTRLRADSIYTQLRKGADFAQLARSFSGDNLTYQTGGEMPEFGIGKYDSAFEAAAFALEKDGAISAPVASSYGYHIIRRIERKPFPRQLSPEVTAELRTQVLGDPRAEISRRALFKKIFQQADLQRRDLPVSDLWTFTDSAQVNSGLASFRNLSYSTVIFSFTRQQYTVKEWLDYVRTVRPGRAGNRTNAELFEQYIDKCALEYYRNHLEEYNKEFAFQLAEFKEGNLLFEIMQRKIWDKASTDSTGLHRYFEAHKEKYWWEASADALLFTCNNEATAEALRARLVRDPNSWRILGDSAGAAVQADSGRYELAQIPALGKSTAAPHLCTPVVVNKGDNTVSFAYILQVYFDRSPRNYRDARGFVINDYQAYLEDQWIAELKKKYPVRVDEATISALPK